MRRFVALAMAHWFSIRNRAICASWSRRSWICCARPPMASCAPQRPRSFGGATRWMPSCRHCRPSRVGCDPLRRRANVVFLPHLGNFGPRRNLAEVHQRALRVLTEKVFGPAQAGQERRRGNSASSVLRSLVRNGLPGRKTTGHLVRRLDLGLGRCARVEPARSEAVLARVGRDAQGAPSERNLHGRSRATVNAGHSSGRGDRGAKRRWHPKTLIHRSLLGCRLKPSDRIRTGRVRPVRLSVDRAPGARLFVVREPVVRAAIDPGQLTQARNDLGLIGRSLTDRAGIAPAAGPAALGLGLSDRDGQFAARAHLHGLSRRVRANLVQAAHDPAVSPLENAATVRGLVPAPVQDPAAQGKPDGSPNQVLAGVASLRRQGDRSPHLARNREGSQKPVPATKASRAAVESAPDHARAV